MPSTDGSMQKRAARAEEKILGTKFCFGCQKHRSVENGKQAVRGRSTSWRCADCLNKRNPMGFKK